MTEKSFIKKIINKYSKRFTLSKLDGIKLDIHHRETLEKEIQEFLKNEKNSEYPSVNYNDSNYIDYYKMMCILGWYYSEKYKLYGNSHIIMPVPQGYEGYCPQRD